MRESLNTYSPPPLPGGKEEPFERKNWSGNNLFRIKSPNLVKAKNLG